MNNGLSPLSIPLNTKIEEDLLHQNFIKQHYGTNTFNNNVNNLKNQTSSNNYSMPNFYGNNNNNQFNSLNNKLIDTKNENTLKHNEVSLKTVINYDDYFNNLKRKLLASEKLYESKNESNFDTLNHLIKNNPNQNSENFNNYISNEKFNNKQSNLETELKNAKKKKNYLEEKLKVNNDHLIKSEITNIDIDEEINRDLKKETQILKDKSNNESVSNVNFSNIDNKKATKKDIKSILSDVEFE